MGPSPKKISKSNRKSAESKNNGPKFRALLIGINYLNVPGNTLTGCQNDIKSIEKYLESHHEVEEIKVLKDAKTDKKFKNKDCPTKANIEMEMKRLAKETKDGDTLVVYYSGHGSHVRDIDGDDKDGRDETICPVDFNDKGFIIDDNLYNMLVKPLPEGAKLRVIFDCCYSGSGMDLPVMWMQQKQYFEENNNNPDADVVFISGCTDTQLSADGALNGALTTGILRALAQRKPGSVTWREFIKLVYQNMNTSYQSPQLSAGSLQDFDSPMDI